MRVRTERGPAYAADAALAQALAVEWDRTALRLEEVLPDVRPVPDLEIWVLPPERIPDPFGVGQPMGGVTYLVGGHPTLIHVPDNDEFLWVLGHELTHAVVDVSPRWRALPGVLEEGLCESMGAVMDPGARPRRWLSVLIEAPPLLGVRGAGIYFPFYVRQENGRVRGMLGVFEGRDTWRAWSPEELRERLEAHSLDPWPMERSGLERLGYFLVERIVARHGLDGLRALCAEAEHAGRRTVSMEATLAAAGLDGYESLATALREEASTAKVREQLAQSPEALARWFVYDLDRVVNDYEGAVSVRPERGWVRGSDSRRRRWRERFGDEHEVVAHMRAILDARQTAAP